MKAKSPLISAICITNNRPRLLQRAIACFEKQTYANKEFVISYPQGDQATRKIIEVIRSKSEIRLVCIERREGQSLGAARNETVAAANGQYVCIWDDDDWYHEHRIAQQYKCIQNGPFKASVLTYIILFNADTKEAFHSGYYPWEGTLLCERKTLLNYAYLDQQKAEDTQVLTNLSANNQLYHITAFPFLYIYIFHRKNTWDEARFNMHFSKASPLNKEISEQVDRHSRLDHY